MVPRIMVITKLDKEHANFGAALESAQKTFSRASFLSHSQLEKKRIFVA
jgi:hypothetical protein